ncbi:hypothetical protein [Flavobacterium caseinilyticum]|uniref:Uncharacterized protein n=1 Tax=Flavobacterium caseinilyticum TaxID=2541732 RepID=A0A4R5B0B6_9FLAO|nr:hypothetical protein [Flavobacterium caseinilyticum]TDD76954.1 hypothetical protein E0F89_04965 [Flavobacterium caseinilyticum]
MKIIQILSSIIMLLVFQFVSAQESEPNTISLKKDNLIHLETSINLSLPVHIMMYRVYRLSIGVNLMP